LFFSSFLLAQKRTQKGSQSLGPLVANYPALLKKEGRCETRHFQWLRQSSRYSFFFFAARRREMAFNYWLVCHYLGQPQKIKLVRGQGARRENSGAYNEYVSRFSRRSNAAIGQDLSFDNKKGGHGQQYFPYPP